MTDYSNKKQLVKEKSMATPDDYDFAMYLSERLEYFSDRFGEEHIQYFDLLWSELKRRLILKMNKGE
jgi:hypothetical protein